jgi:transcriptional regulator with XRE-family HTH domain
MVTVTLHIGESYIKELKARLRKAGISHRQVALEMGIDPSQFSRWTTEKVAPRMNTVEEIEAAFARLVKKQAK